jgi:NAD(P)-dependent dehydrogenase (short-subunit alcohol dehydrogenase family)
MSTKRPCALVTGAGRGLGRAIANAFHENGYTVVATDFDEALLADLIGVEGYLTRQQDVSDTERAVEIADFIENEVGRLDVIVNNAGINPFYPVCEAPPERTIQCFRVNTFGALIVSQPCLDLLIKSRGCIVNIASESSLFRAPFQIYQSSKMALECLSDVMRRELMLFDVHVATIRPGAIDTNLIEETKVVPIDVKESRFEPFFPRLREMIGKRVPKRLSQPSEVAAIVYKAATDPKRKVMYRINNDPLQRIVPLFPAKLVDRLIRSQLRP